MGLAGSEPHKHPLCSATPALLLCSMGGTLKQVMVWISKFPAGSVGRDLVLALPRCVPGADHVTSLGVIKVT